VKRGLGKPLDTIGKKYHNTPSPGTKPGHFQKNIPEFDKYRNIGIIFIFCTFILHTTKNGIHKYKKG
jgi:hypothetical protein